MLTRFEKTISSEKITSEKIIPYIFCEGNPQINPPLLNFSFKKFPPPDDLEYPFAKTTNIREIFYPERHICCYHFTLNLPKRIFKIEMKFASSEFPKITHGQKISLQDVEIITKTKQLLKSDILNSTFVTRKIYENIFLINDQPIEEYLQFYCNSVKNVAEFLTEYQNSIKICVHEAKIEQLANEKAKKVLGLK